MRTITSVRDMQATADATRMAWLRVGLVPTMGFLHEGHASLIRRAKERSEVVVVSVFVNPLQFGPSEDFTRYPRDAEHDARIAAEAGCDVLFMPEADEMYPPEFQTTVSVAHLGERYEGAVRPGHFDGVATVVAKLFLIVRPHVAVFGQKDAQQSLIIRRMARDLNLDVDLIIAPTIREADGLAMSSRNVYLSPEERRQAVSLSQALVIGVDAALAGATPDAVRAALAARIGREPDAVIDYAEVADTETLDPLSSFDGKDAAILLLAVRLGRTRLIDNAIVNFTAAP